MFAPIIGGALYAATDGGIYRSKDNGDTWESITRMNTGITIAQIYHVCSSPQQPDVLYYGAQDNGTYRLDISGETREVFGGDGFVCQVDPQNSNTVYASYADGDIERTDDAAGTWRHITPVVGNYYVYGPWLTPYILGPADPNDSAYGYSIYACYTDLWYSSDHGDSSQNLTNGALGNSNECRQVAVAPSDPKTIYVAKAGELDLKYRAGEQFAGRVMRGHRCWAEAGCSAVPTADIRGDRSTEPASGLCLWPRRRSPISRLAQPMPGASGHIPGLQGRRQSVRDN